MFCEHRSASLITTQAPATVFVMKTSRDGDWPGSWTHAIGREVARLRKERGLTVAALCDVCADLGIPVPRNTVGNLENGRKETLPLHELVTLATALGVSPLALAYPEDGRAWEVEYMPGQEVSIIDARRQFRGAPGEEITPGQMLDRLMDREHLEALANSVNRARTMGGSVTVIATDNGTDERG